MSDVIFDSKQSDRAFFGAIERYLTPDATPTNYRCRRVRIPDDMRFVAALNELISRLGFPEMYEETPGGMTPDECAALGSQLFYDYAESDGYCMIGAILPFAGNDMPGNMLECDGSTHNRADYPLLYAILDENFIVDPDTFVTPDLRGRMALGVSDDYGLSSIGGAAFVTLATENLPAHTHVQDAHNHTQDSHNHVQNAHGHTGNSHSHNLSDPGHTHGMNHTHPIQGQSTSTPGTTQSFMRSTLVGADGDMNTGASSAANTGSSATGATVDSSTVSVQNATATNQATTATNQATTATNQNTGGGIAHNNLPPYLALRMVIVAR